MFWFCKIVPKVDKPQFRAWRKKSSLYIQMKNFFKKRKKLRIALLILLREQVFGGIYRIDVFFYLHSASRNKNCSDRHWTGTISVGENDSKCCSWISLIALFQWCPTYQDSYSGKKQLFRNEWFPAYRVIHCNFEGKFQQLLTWIISKLAKINANSIFFQFHPIGITIQGTKIIFLSFNSVPLVRVVRFRSLWAKSRWQCRWRWF